MLIQLTEEQVEDYKRIVWSLTIMQKQMLTLYPEQKDRVTLIALAAIQVLQDKPMDAEEFNSLVAANKLPLRTIEV